MHERPFTQKLDIDLVPLINLSFQQSAELCIIQWQFDNSGVIALAKSCNQSVDVYKWRSMCNKSAWKDLVRGFQNFLSNRFLSKEKE